MKKLLSIALGAVLVLGLAGCSGNQPADGSKKGTTSSDGKVEFQFYTGSQGGGYMAFGAMFVDEWEKNIPNFKASVVSGGSFTNAVNVEQSKTGMDLGASFNTVLYDGLKYQGDFKGRVKGPLQNVRAMARLNRQSLFLAPTLKEKVPEGVTTLGEFLATKPKIRLFTKDRGTGGEIATRKVLEAYGLTYEDIESWGGKVTYSSTSDGVAAVVDGQAEAVWQTYVPFAADLQELESAREIVYLQIDEEAVKKVTEGYGYMAFKAPADWFKDKQSVNTFAEDTIVYTHKDAPEDAVYQMTKIILQNKEKWFNGQKAFETFEPENAWKETVVPLHPGAEKAYKELGYMK